MDCPDRIFIPNEEFWNRDAAFCAHREMECALETFGGTWRLDNAMGGYAWSPVIVNAPRTKVGRAVDRELDALKTQSPPTTPK